GVPARRQQPGDRRQRRHDEPGRGQAVGRPPAGSGEGQVTFLLPSPLGGEGLGVRGRCSRVLPPSPPAPPPQGVRGGFSPQGPSTRSATRLRQVLRPQLDDLRGKGLYKNERRLQGPQGSAISVAGREVINFCANNSLGLANHPAIVEAAHEGLRRYGYGMASVRFICGTQTPHKQLESTIARFLGKDDAILYSSCWDANGGLFETILGDED